MWDQKFHIVAIQPFLEESIVNIATDNYEEEKLLSLIESKIIESALHDLKEIELRKFLNTFQGLSESGTKDISTTPLVLITLTTVILQQPIKSLTDGAVIRNQK